jgi:hypothetical protein
MQDPSEKLRCELISAYKFYTVRAYANYGAYLLAYGTALIATALATIAVATGLFGRSVQAVLTASPGVIFVAMQSLRLHSKYRWHQRHAWDVKGLLHRLDFEDAKVADVSRRLRLIRARYMKSYPAMRLNLHGRKQSKQMD